MRTFIQYDGDGEVVAVVQTESLPAGLEHPFYLEDETHGVLELREGDEAARRPGAELGQGFRVDVARRKLVGKSAPKPAAREATTKEAATEAPPTKAATADSAAETVTKRAAPKKAAKKAAPKKAAKKTATKKAATKKTAAKKAAAKKGGRSSGSK